MSLCHIGKAGTPPIYKIITADTVYVYVGNAGDNQKLDKIFKKIESGKALVSIDVSELEKTYSKDYKAKLGMDLTQGVKFVDMLIYHDDTIATLHHKIAMHVTDGDIKLQTWCNRRIIDRDSIFTHVVNNIFNNRVYVSSSELETIINTVFSIDVTLKHTIFNRDTAFKAIAKSNPTFMIEPMSFYHHKDGRVVYTRMDGDFADLEICDTMCSLIESHAPEKHRIYLQKKEDARVFTTYDSDVKDGLTRDAKLLSNIWSGKGILDEANGHIKCSLSKIALRINETNEDIVDLAHIMTMFEPNSVTPFLKYVTTTGITFKLFKDSVPLTISEKMLLHWTDLESSMLRSSNDVLIFKVSLNKATERFATLILHENGMYDVRFNFGIMNSVQLLDMKKTFDLMNNVVASINKLSNVKIVPIETTVWKSKPGESFTSIQSYDIISIVQTQGVKIAKVDALVNVAKIMSPVFSYVGMIGGNKIHLTYKRVDKFTKNENIILFMRKNYTLEKKPLIEKTIDYFGITVQSALDYYEYCKSDSNATEMGKLFRARPTNTVNIYLSPTGYGYVVYMEGMTQLAYQKRIIRHINVLISQALLKKPDIGKLVKHNIELDDKSADNSEINEEIDIEDEIDIDDENEIDDENVELNPDFWADFDNFRNQDNVVKDKDDDDENKEDKGDDDEDDDDDIPEIKEKDKPKVKGQVKDSANINNFILQELYKADYDLFKPSKGRKDRYAKRCQMTMTRQPRQPVVVNAKELAIIEKKYPDAINNKLSYGSTAELTAKNTYICPQVWCPRNRIAMSSAKFEANGNKCDGPLEDFPITYYKSSYFAKAKVYAKVMKFKDKDNTDEFCAPCCYARPPLKGDDTCDVGVKDIGDTRYIMRDNIIPLDKDRYGMLPHALSKLFGNTDKNCGSRHNGTGHMRNATDCFLRYGVSIKQQSFLECMVSVMHNQNIKTDEDIINALVNNVTADVFVILGDGAICRRFLDDTVDINNRVQYNKFKSWFTKRDTTVFHLKNVYNYLFVNVVFDISKKYAQQVLREFHIYNAYERFHAYLKDDNIIKTHDFLLDVFTKVLPWLNTHGYNIVMFDAANDTDVSFRCPITGNTDLFRQERETIFIIKQGLFYEPIHHVKVRDSIMDSDDTHQYNDPRVHKIIKYYVKQCKSKLKNAFKESLDVFNALQQNDITIKAYVLDYQIRVTGVLCDDDLYIPFKETVLLSVLEQYIVDSASINSFMFIDSMYSDIKPDFTTSAALARFKLLNESLYEPDESLSVKNKWLTFPKTKQTVLLRHTAQSDSIPGYLDIVGDLHVFNKWFKNDERMESVNALKSMDNMRSAMMYEMLYILSRDNELKEMVEFMRHGANPMPRTLKRNILMDKIEKWIPRIMYIANGSDLHTGKYVQRSCSLLGRKDECIAQCRMVKPEGDNKGMFCRLRVPSGIYNMLIARVLDDLVNASIPLKKPKYQSDHENKDNGGSVVVFTDEDVRTGRIKTIVDTINNGVGVVKNVVKFDYNVFNNIDGPVQEEVADFVTVGKTETMHTKWQSEFKGFNVYTNENYNAMTLYDIFNKVVNTLNPRLKMTPETLKTKMITNIMKKYDENSDETIDMLRVNPMFSKNTKKRDDIISWFNDKSTYPSTLELQTLGEIANINVVVIGRIKKPHYLDSLRCLTLRETLMNNFILLNQRTNTASGKPFDMYEIIGKQKDGVKYIFTLADFAERAAHVVKNSCTQFFL